MLGLITLLDPAIAKESADRNQHYQAEKYRIRAE
jgi:hypothetical protein